MDGNQQRPTRDGAAPAVTSAGQITAAMQDPRSRRDFLRAAGLGGATLVLGGALTACATDVPSPLAPGGAASLAVVNGNNITLDFSSDIDVLNYAYALEQLEAAFYTQVVATAGFSTRFAANEQRVLVDLRDHEIVHREFLRTALGAAAIPDLSVDFSAVDFTSRASVLTTARTFEDLGVGAYNGSGQYLRNPDFLTVAGKIVSVEARHAAAIRDILDKDDGVRAENEANSFAPSAFDPAHTPSFVLAAADPFVVQNITVINA
jgi:rubrerythrin